jgi:subfamily B ATP-binding cassette protein MsbA
MNNKDLAIRIFQTEIKKYYNLIIICFIFMIISAATTAASAWLLDPAIKMIFVNKDREMLYLIPLAIVIVLTLKGISTFFVKIISIKIGLNITENIQIKMSEKILNLDIAHISEKHSGKFISNFVIDIHFLLSTISNTVINSIKESLTLIALICVMIYHDWKLSILALTVLPVAAIFSKKIGKKMGKTSTQNMIAQENLSTLLSELIKGSWLIKIYQKESEELTRLKILLSEKYKKAKKVEQVRLGAGPIMEFIIAIAIALIIFMGGYRSINGGLSMSEFVSFLAALMLAYAPVRALAGLNIGFNEGMAAASRIYELIDKKNEIKEDKNLPDLKISSGNIIFKNVNFTYPDNSQILNNININITGGKRTAIIGESGSGKSTILNLIPRFYNLIKGKILIDGQEINTIKLSSLRKNMSIVSQDTILFDDTIKKNIAYANNNATNEEIYKASELAGINNFIDSLKNGYETIVGENGIKLSGGQKQRISIARAFLKNAPIILLDEATSSLDSVSEEKIKQALEDLTKNRTTLIISHKLSTIMNCDKIYVIQNGQIVTNGTHLELIKNSIYYKNLYDKQSLN